ncbi:MAG: hypothetical protein ABIV47_00760 [Roseiflexaceae bacterium]
MRSSLIESLVLGCGIALGVVLVQVLTQGTPVITQLLALLVAGVVLFCLQFALALRRSRRGVPSPEEHGERQQRSRPLRQRRRNSFTRELTHDWTGLEDHATERDLAGPYVPDDLDELWGEPPDTPVPKAAAKVDDPR